ncbi:hypothetical protein EPUL_001674 [Erysiphe pulchra]|uniref:Reverse transcriptase domain-containing protein n=1 Tax=Erysiphe pulchra TaxID=225359 RepID=A0A2S4PW05_9PEZI|nr:hypothetical protein EPUL_001674 [Erysiphe pulchra]
MAPASLKRVIPPEPSEAVNRITKHKTTVSKPNSSSKSSRMPPFTTEALRKAEVLEKTLGSQIPTEDIIESMEIQIESTAGENPLSASNISQEKQARSLPMLRLQISIISLLLKMQLLTLMAHALQKFSNLEQMTDSFYACRRVAKLGSDDQLLSNILPTKTGFALCPSKGNSSALANKLALSNILDGKLIQKSSVWTSYRISNVLRKIGTLRDNFEHHLVPVITADVTTAITAAAGAQPISPSCSQSSTPGSENFVEWADDNYFCLLSPLDKKIHKRGNVLDLALGSGPLLRHLKCCIATHLDSTSDPLPLLTTIGWGDAPKTHQRLRPDSLNSTLFQNLLISFIKQVAPVPSHSTTDFLDKLVEGIIQAIQLAYSGAAHRSLGHGTAKVDQANTGKDIFAMTKWHKSRGTYRSTPLADLINPDRPLATTTVEKRLVLLKNLLVNSTDVGDISFNALSVHVRSISLPPLTLQEVQNSILRAGNTAPGSDEIRTSVLKIAWPLIKDHIYTLFARCLSVGHHPKCFRHATLVMLQKPNKSDLSSPRSHRPTALLTVLRKGLERLIAKRLAWISVKHKTLASQHFGALPSLNERWTASMLTLDVKGAFDAVLPVGSFATDRMVQIYVDDEMGPPQNITSGLLQGSPVSPVLFMLYISPLLKLGNSLKKFCYADDVAILVTKNSLSENCQELSNTLAETIKWGQAEGITFDPNKSELQHFSRCRRDKDPF